MTTAPLSPFDKVHAYMRGWHCGAGVKIVDETLANHPRQEVRDLWGTGYDDGVKARAAVAARICRRFKYKPNFLRLEEAEDAKS